MNLNTIWNARTMAVAVLAAAMTMPVMVAADDATATLEEVVVMGSRGAPRSVGDSPVPVDVIDADELGKSGSNDLMMQFPG